MPLEKPKHIQLQWNVLQLIHNAVQFEWTINLYKQKRTHGWLNNKQTYNHDDKSWLKFHKRHDGEVRTKPINNADTVSCLASEDSDSSINGETSCIVYGLSLPFYFQHQPQPQLHSTKHQQPQGNNNLDVRHRESLYFSLPDTNSERKLVPN